MDPIPKSPVPTGPEQEPSFQVMPQEGRFQDVNMPQTSSSPSPVPPAVPGPKQSAPSMLPEEMEPSGSKAKLFYIIGGVVLLLILGALGYYMLGGKKSDTQQADQTASTKLPKVWLKQYFDKEICNDPKICGDDADPDSDGLKNYDEFKAGSSPTNADSDSDGLADGDEVYIYKTDPIHKFTDRRDIVAQNNWTDGYQIKSGYDPLTPGLKFTDARLKQIADDITRIGLHEPSKTTLGTTQSNNSDSTNSGNNSTSGSSQPASQAVAIQNSAFSPSTLTIKKGDTVVWTNNDSVSHTVTADKGEFSSQTIPNLGKYSFTFSSTGTFSYHCAVHPSMKATIVVQ